MKKSARGMTLIELMIVVAILGIIVAIGYPSYQDHIKKARRTEGMGELLELGKLLAANDDLAKYDRYRDYAPGVIPDQHLREIDQDLTDDPDDPDDNPSVEDGTPAQVDDLTTGPGTALNRDILGPNFAIGRRTWIDLRQ